MAEGVDILGTLGGYAGIAQAGMGVLQSIIGIGQQGKARKEINRLMSQRQAFQTPEEVYQTLQATQANAQTGLGSEVLSYLTGQNERGLSQGIGAATLLGGDANDLGALLDRYNTQSMGIGAQDQAAQMANFSKYLGALGVVAQNREAEWQSRDNLLKDRIQAAAARGQQGTLNLQSGLNATLGAITAGQQMGLYNQNLNYLNNLNMVNSVTGVPLANTPTAPVTQAVISNAGANLANQGITPRQ